MKPSKTPLKIDLLEYINIIQSLKITEHRKLNYIFSDLTNYIYDTYEFILNLAGKPDSLKKLKKEQINEMLKDLERIYKQSSQILDILEGIDYDSKPLDRLEYILTDLEDEIRIVIIRLKKANK